MCPLLRTYLYITWTKRRFIMSYTFLTVKKSNFLLTSCRFVVGVLIIHTSNHQLNHCHAVAQNLYSQNNHLGMTCSKWIKTIYTKNVSTITMLDNWLNYIRSTFYFSKRANLWIVYHFFSFFSLIIFYALEEMTFTYSKYLSWFICLCLLTQVKPLLRALNAIAMWKY